MTKPDTPQTPNDALVERLTGIALQPMADSSEELEQEIRAALAPYIVIDRATARDEISDALMTEFGGDENENPISDMDADVIAYRILTRLTGSASPDAGEDQ